MKKHLLIISTSFLIKMVNAVVCRIKMPSLASLSRFIGRLGLPAGQEGVGSFKKRVASVVSIFSIVFLINDASYAQSDGNTFMGQRIGNGVITTAVPFVNIGPDARGSALGEAGVATTADVNSLHWNNAKLAFIDGKYGGSASYSPWLNKITTDMFLSYVSGYFRIDELQAIGASMRFFSHGDFEINDNLGNYVSSLNPYEVAVDLTYSRKLTEALSVGVTGRYIRSNTARQFVALEETNIGSTIAVDLGIYYLKSTNINGRNVDLSFGAHLSNFGPKIKYNNFGPKDPIPTNLRLGTSVRYYLDKDNSVTFVLDLNKLMVPTPPVVLSDQETGELYLTRGKETDRNLLSSTFGSLTDAPGGFSEELKELTFSPGVEYWYKEVFALRGGYFHEHKQKGNRQYLTTGLGFRYQTFGFDASYLIPFESNHPLAETLRLSVLVNFD